MNESGFLVEDGTGLVDANSYVSVESADNYYTLRAYTDWEKFPLSLKEAALIQATLYIDTQYDWRGVQSYDDQGLSFPRSGIYTPKNEPVVGVPNSIKRATLELAKKVVRVNSDGTYNLTELVPDIDIDNKVKKTRNKFAVMEEEVIYMTPIETSGLRPFPSIDALIPKYLIRLDDTRKIIMTSIICNRMTKEENCCGNTRNIK